MALPRQKNGLAKDGVIASEAKQSRAANPLFVEIASSLRSSQ